MDGRRETIHFARENRLGRSEQPTLRRVEVSGDGRLDGGAVAHTESRHVFHLETRKTVFKVERVSPALFHVLGPSRKDREKLVSQAGRRSQEFPIIDVPLLVGGTLQCRPFNIEAAHNIQ